MRPNDAIKITPIKEAGLVWTLSLVLIGAFGTLALFVPFIADNLLAFVAVTFWYLPMWALAKSRVDLSQYGLKIEPLTSGLAHFIVVTLIIIPPFVVGHHYWQKIVLGNSPDWSHQQFNRFAQDFDGRPELPQEGEALCVWHESKRFWFLCTGQQLCKVQVEMDVSPGENPNSMARSISPSQDGTKILLSYLPGLRVDSQNNIDFTHKGTGGFTFPSDHVKSISVSTTAPEVRTGRYAMGADSKFQAERSTWWWLWMFVMQFILVAVPEEWFYRGYLQQRFSDVWTENWNVLGAKLGWGWILASVLFALGHLVLDFRPERLAVFFPSLLFGWLKARTGSILAPSLFHAISNVTIQSLNYVYFA